MKWLLFVSFFILSCASVEQIEEHQKKSLKSIERLFEGRRPPSLKLRETAKPIIEGSKWIRAWRGSYSENGMVVNEGWIYIKLEDEKPVTSF